MSRCLAFLKKMTREYILPRVTDQEKRRMDEFNFPTVRNASGFIVLVAVLLLIYMALQPGRLPRNSFLSIGVCVLDCGFIFLLAEHWERSQKEVSTRKIHFLTEFMYWSLSLLGLAGSYCYYKNGEQMLLLETVQVIFAIVLCTHPLEALARLVAIFGSLIILSLLWNSGRELVNANFIMLPLILLIGYIINYSRMLKIIRLQSKMEEQIVDLKDKSSHDALTGLKNRLALREDFPGYVGKQVCVVMADIDYFKLFNDTFGHAMGDMLLHGLGMALLDLFGDNACYRFGGDEFLIITMDEPTRVKECLKKAEKMMQDIHGLPVEVKPCLSYGIIEGYVDKESILRKLQKEADDKLYRMKKKR